jgi:hypothetical protein
MTMKTGIWRYSVMLLAVVLAAAICVTALAQQDDGDDNRQRQMMRPRGEGERQGDRAGGQQAMMRMMQPAAPVMIVEKPYLYILAANVLYQIDSETLEQINAVYLVPPPPPEGMQRARFGPAGPREGQREGRLREKADQ